MNINNKKILIFLMTIMLCQFQMVSLKADEHSSLDDEELPAIDPFAGGVSTNQAGETDTQVSSNNGLLNNMRLVGTITAENKQIAVFSAADGGAYKYEEDQAITDTTMIRNIYSDFVIVEDGENNLFEVYMNNIIKPSDG
ncbi:hypothetical protein [Candidatus Pelagibacter sp. Uisw_130]|uniref:hypothetical protein n=1 Tax=Candidatus Pelagibacter sp. Uisw_130 TaxID=3230989 RepID=UPI0039E8E025